MRISRSQNSLSWKIAGLMTTTLAFSPDAIAGTFTGPSTNVPPYVIPAAAGVDITSLLTVGDLPARNGYEMVGVPDGLGAYRKGKKTTVLMNHELQKTQGIVRAHGSEGAFVSKLTIGPDGEVLKGSDFIQSARYFDYGTFGDNEGTYVENAPAPYINAFSRFCSSTLAPAGHFYDADTKVGEKGFIYFATEEDGPSFGPHGRVFGVDKKGVAHQLPHLGLFSWENAVPAPNQTPTTMVLGMEDGGSTDSELWVYVGTKQKKGTAVDKAGLTNGLSYVVAVDDGAAGVVNSDAEYRSLYDKGDLVAFTLAEIPWDASGTDQNDEAKIEGTPLCRIEDGSFDPQNPDHFYFVTTCGGEGGSSTGGLWRVVWTNIEQPLLGGTIELLLDGTETVGGVVIPNPDNMTIDTHGNLLIQEDPGSSASFARIVAYRLSDGALGEVAMFDPDLFTTGEPGFLTTNEESSGIIDMEPLGYPAGTFLFDAQVHTGSGLAADPDPMTDNPGTVDEYVERGQLLELLVTNFDLVYPTIP